MYQEKLFLILFRHICSRDNVNNGAVDTSWPYSISVVDGELVEKLIKSMIYRDYHAQNTVNVVRTIHRVVSFESSITVAEMICEHYRDLLRAELWPHKCNHELFMCILHQIC